MFVAKEMMKKTDILKNFRQVMFTTQHTLTPDQHRELVRGKLERAERQSRIFRATQARLGRIAEDRV